MGINRLIAIVASCDLQDVTSLRKLYLNDNKYFFDGMEIICSESHRTTPEWVNFKLRIPVELLGLAHRDRRFDILTADHCHRGMLKHLDGISLSKYNNTGKAKYTGAIEVHRPGPQVLQRNSSYVKDDSLYIMFRIRFPVLMKAKHNVVSGRLAIKIIRKELVRALRDFVDTFDLNAYEEDLTLYKRQCEIRSLLIEHGYISFIANGSILPRGEGELPLADAVPFVSPSEDEVELTLSDGLTLKGLAIRKGVTVVTGGGYSGKSTFLDSALMGIYNHVRGDGREYCITETNSCKILAEEGRAITKLDISPFIAHTDKFSTKCFTSPDASGSTSQAANIMEAISFGCKTLFIDEDRTATNFMIRDARMKKLIPNDPIIPFTDRVRQIYEQEGVSTILIIGGSSEYLDIADKVFMMKDYVLKDITLDIADIQNEYVPASSLKVEKLPRWAQERFMRTGPMGTYVKGGAGNRIREHLAVAEKSIVVGNYSFDVSKIETLISRPQLVAIAFIIRAVLNNNAASCFNLYDQVCDVYAKVQREGFESISKKSRNSAKASACAWGDPSPLISDPR